MRGPLRFMLGASPIARDPLYRAAGQLPAFDFRFDRGTITDVIRGLTPTFTRPTAVQNLWTGSGFTSFAADVPGFAVDPATGRTGVALEPAATNLFLNSTAPATQGIAVTAQVYTLSFYGTGTITLSGASTAGPLVGTGAAPNRVSLTFTPSAGTLTLTLTGTIVRPQLETGTVATSPIDTTGSAVTRTATTMTLGGADFAAVYNQLGGTWFAGGTADATASSVIRFATIEGASAAAIRLGFQNINVGGLEVINTAGANQVALFPGVSTRTRRFAASTATDNFQVSVNGATPITDFAGTLDSMDRILFGNPGPILLHRLAYFPPGSAQSRIQQMPL
jgi:hypothetical protein